MPRRRERILGFDRLTGIEIADLADRLVEVWPGDDGDGGDLAQARIHVDDLARGAEQLTRIVAVLRAALVRMEGDGDGVDR